MGTPNVVRRSDVHRRRAGLHYYAVDHSPSYLWNSATWEISEALLDYLLPVVVRQRCLGSGRDDPPRDRDPRRRGAEPQDPELPVPLADLPVRRGLAPPLSLTRIRPATGGCGFSTAVAAADCALVRVVCRWAYAASRASMHIDPLTTRREGRAARGRSHPRQGSSDVSARRPRTEPDRRSPPTGEVMTPQPPARTLVVGYDGSRRHAPRWSAIDRVIRTAASSSCTRTRCRSTTAVPCTTPR